MEGAAFLKTEGVDKVLHVGDLLLGCNHQFLFETTFIGSCMVHYCLFYFEFKVDFFMGP